jgi:HK97 family phage prohead protease
VDAIICEFKAAPPSGTGRFEGYGAVKGNVDLYGDIILDGAFGNLTEFATRGGILLGHDWSSLPVAIVESAKEDANGLYLSATWHSDAESQRARTVVEERIASGKFVGLSIGYQTLDSSTEDRDGKSVRLLKQITVHEVSIVLTPANPKAGVVMAKTLADEFGCVLDATRNLARRVENLKALREAEGRRLSEATRDRLKAACDEVASLQQALSGLAAPDEECLTPSSGAFDANRAYADHLARLYGLTG